MLTDPKVMMDTCVHRSGSTLSPVQQERENVGFANSRIFHTQSESLPNVGVPDGGTPNGGIAADALPREPVSQGVGFADPAEGQATPDSTAPRAGLGQFDGPVLDSHTARPWDEYPDDAVGVDLGDVPLSLGIPTFVDPGNTVLGPEDGLGDLDIPTHFASIKPAVRYAATAEVTIGQSIGSIEVVKGDTYVIRSDGVRLRLQVGDQLFIGDTLETVTDGGLGMVLADGTRLSLGSGGCLVLDEMIFDSDTDDGFMHLSMVEGTLALASGLITGDSTDSWVAYRGSDNMLYQVTELRSVSPENIRSNDFVGVLT